MKAHKIALLTFLFLGIAGTAAAQDVILKKDNTTILSKVLEITTTEIKYKKWSNQEGPTYSITRAEVTSINYQNGEVERFTDPVANTQILQQAETTHPTVQAPKAYSQTKPQNTNSPYLRGKQYNYNGMIIPQFSLHVGMAVPVGKFGTTNNIHTSLLDYCVPFQIFADNLGISNQVGIGAAKTGFSGSMRLHSPVYENGNSIIGIPIIINVLNNGISDSEKQAYKSIIEPATSETLNEAYGVNAFQFNVTDFPRYWNFSLMMGIDYTYYISKPFALFAEGTVGLNVIHVTPTKMQNRLGGTYIAQYSVYSMKEFNLNYTTKANFTYELGGGILLFDHLSIGAFYTGNSSVQLSFDVDAANISGGESILAQKLQVSALNIQLGYHF